jgi:hypothetical protein
MQDEVEVAPNPVPHQMPGHDLPISMLQSNNDGGQYHATCCYACQEDAGGKCDRRFIVCINGKDVSRLPHYVKFDQKAAKANFNAIPHSLNDLSNHRGLVRHIQSCPYQQL